MHFMNKTDVPNPAANAINKEVPGLSRRRFFGAAGLALGAGILSLEACSKDDDNGINLGSGDTGVLNYAYALEQLEAAFYIKVIDSPYSGIPADELALLTDVRDHEIAHREFFKTVLGVKAIQELDTDFSSIDFTDRKSVLEAARAFEDLGVQAYNGAGQLLTSPDNLLLAGKIVSVEARHAAYIRELLVPGSFADITIVDPNSRADYGRSPAQVLAVAGRFIKNGLNAGNLPTS